MCKWLSKPLNGLYYSLNHIWTVKTTPITNFWKEVQLLCKGGDHVRWPLCLRAVVELWHLSQNLKCSYNLTSRHPIARWYIKKVKVFMVNYSAFNASPLYAPVRDFQDHTIATYSNTWLHMFLTFSHRHRSQGAGWAVAPIPLPPNFPSHSIEM